MSLEAFYDQTLYQTSMVIQGDTRFSMVRAGPDKRLLIEGDTAGFEGADPRASSGEGRALLCPLNAANAAALRQRLSWLNPVPLGMAPSAGFGDRLGLATPGHARALRPFPGIAPVFAQQSVRENKRTGRTPQQVLDDAMWGAFQEGWREPWGADADHLKTVEDIHPFTAAGYTFFTVDPGEYVDNAAHTASAQVLEAKLDQMPWDRLETTRGDMERRCLDRPIDLEGFQLRIDQEKLWRAAAKYARAVLHAAQIYRALLSEAGARPFELEVSVDETETPTTPAEHWYIAAELARLGVRWVSLAPRYIGRFEKGVDYIGDLEEFTAEFAHHAAIARAIGPYKLSLHSGSDKFSIYPIAARLARGQVHVKTAGTSYLEALRATARTCPALFREIYAFSRSRYQADRRTYHVSAELIRAPQPAKVSDADLPALLDQFDARQVLHVTYGSVLDEFGSRLKQALAEREEEHYAALEAHFHKHLAPFHPFV